MKNRNVFILTAALLGLSLYAYFGEYKREINQEAQKNVESRIITLKKDQIQKIEITKGDGVLISVGRTVDGWDVLSPVQDQADNEIIEAFLDQITSEKAVDVIEPESLDLTVYGLKPSLGHVRLTDNVNKKQEIEISTKKNFEGLVFLRRDQEPRILTSSQTWTTFLTKPVDQFRNLRLFRGSIAKVDVIKLENLNGRFEFRYTDGFWFSPLRTDWKIDQNAVRQILTEVTTSKGSAVIAEKKPFGPVGKHLLTLEFRTGTQNWKGLLHQDTKSKDVIGAISPDRMIIRFAPQTLEDLRTKKLIDFRDKAEPFVFPKNEIKKIVALTKVKSFTLIKSKDLWRLEKSDEAFTVNSTLADDLIGKLNKMTVYRFVEKAPPSIKLDSEVQLYDSDNKLVFKMSWGEFKENEGFAQTNLFKEKFLMDDAQINRLLFHEIVKPKPTQTELEAEEKEKQSEKN